jgi:hypothetical protein
VSGADVLVAIAIVVLVCWWYSVERHPFRRCPSCKGKKKNAGSNELRWGLCGRCGGKGHVRRFGAGPGPPGPPEPPSE